MIKEAEESGKNSERRSAIFIITDGYNVQNFAQAFLNHSESQKGGSEYCSLSVGLVDGDFRKVILDSSSQHISLLLRKFVD